MAKKQFEPGEPAPISGEMEIIGPRGGDTGKTRTVVLNRPLPPTPKAGQTYQIATRAHNRAGHGK